MSKFNAYIMNAHVNACTRAGAYTYTPAAYQKMVFKKRTVFKEDLKELTEVEWLTETGSWFQITGAC